MMMPDINQFRLEVSAEDESAEEIDEMTRQLVSELKDTDVESVELAKGGSAPQGSKSAELITTGAIVMTLMPAVLPKIIDMVQAWITSGKGRTVKFKGKVGKQQIEFEGPPEELKKLLVVMEAENKKR
jgi:hypothetical protein